MNSSEYKGTERRPIASREAAVSQRVATWFAIRGVSPNAISVAGMIAAIFGGLAVYSTSFEGWHWRAAWLTGAVMTQLRLLANMLDGMVAIERDVASPIGELYNEVPDRISDVAILVSLGYAAGGNPAAGWAAALTAIFTAYVRATVKVAGAPHDFCGPMAKPQRMFLVTILGLYCGLSPVSWQPLLTDWQLGPAAITLIIIILGGLVTSLRRLWRAGAHLTGVSA